MAYLFITALLILIALALAARLGRGFALTMPFTLLAAIVVLYLLGLSGLLAWALPLLYLTALGAVLYLALPGLPKKQGLPEILTSPALLLFIAALVLNYLWSYQRLLFYWDEFSHWGLVVKNMVLFDALGTAPEASTVYRDYQPASSLFLYLYQAANRVYHEPLLYLSFNVLQLSLLLPVLGLYSRLRQALLPAVLLLLLPVLVDGIAYNRIMVDILVGLLFAYLLTCYYLAETDRFNLANLALAASVLALTKQVGIFFVALAALIIIADALARSKGLRRTLPLALPPAVALAAYLSWDLYLRYLAVPFFRDPADLTPAAIFGLFGGLADYQQSTIAVFFVEFKPYLQMALYLLGICAVAWLFCRGDHKAGAWRLALFGGGLTAGLMLYAFLLLLLYLLAFGASEAEVLFHFRRYMTSYQLGAALALTGLLLLLARDRPLARNLLLTYVLLHAAITALPRLAMNYDEIAAGRAMRERFATTHLFDSFMDQDDHLYVISQGTSGWTVNLIRHNVAPARVGGRWSLGPEPYFEGDTYTTDVDPAAWAATLREEYTYLYLYRVDERFAEHYGHLFPDPGLVESDRLFAVRTAPCRPGLELVPVDPFAKISKREETGP